MSSAEFAQEADVVVVGLGVMGEEFRAESSATQLQVRGLRYRSKKGDRLIAEHGPEGSFLLLNSLDQGPVPVSLLKAGGTSYVRRGNLGPVRFHTPGQDQDRDRVNPHRRHSVRARSRTGEKVPLDGDTLTGMSGAGRPPASRVIGRRRVGMP